MSTAGQRQDALTAPEPQGALLVRPAEESWAVIIVDDLTPTDAMESAWDAAIRSAQDMGFTAPLWTEPDLIVYDRFALYFLDA